MISDGKQVAWFDELTRNDVARVGGKNASLGEMVPLNRAAGGRGGEKRRTQGAGGVRPRAGVCGAPRR